MSETDSPRDLLLWGATGVVGRLVAEDLTERYGPAELPLTLGGRNERRLRRLESRLCERTDDWDELPVVVGDATDADRMREVAAETDVVCTTVGPYTTYGTPLVAACLEAGTDYCDLTGEVNWVRETVDRFHDRAAERGVRIVHCCGFDSIPADLGTLLVQSTAIESHGAACDLVRVYLEEGRGGVSGGTLASGAALFEAASSDPIARRTLRNPHSLAPRGERHGIDSGGRRGPGFDSLRAAWTAPSPMTVVNERVIHRSNALLDYPWGREFEYEESVPTGRGASGALRAAGLTAGMGLATGAMAVGPTREALQRFVFPDPGEGPSSAEIENGHFTVRVLGRGTGEDGPFVVESRIGADRDPGYGATARMLGEAARCLLRGDVDSPLDGGVLTPASGIGQPLAEGLRRAGLTVAVEEWAGPKGQP